LEYAAEIALKFHATVCDVVCPPDNFDFREICYERRAIGSYPAFTVLKCTVNNSNIAAAQRFEVICNAKQLLNINVIVVLFCRT
jgi:hypothetical protein